jgi:hypothetical protein
LLIGAWYRREMAKYADSATQLGVAAVLCRGIDYVSRLSQWLVREKSADGSGGHGDSANHVFYNQALNTFLRRDSSGPRATGSRPTCLTTGRASAA